VDINYALSSFLSMTLMLSKLEEPRHKKGPFPALFYLLFNLGMTAA
jgi:hypothetical protein